MSPADRYDTSGSLEGQYEPGSNGTVLRNLLGITSREELGRVEEVRFERLLEEAAARFDSDHHFTVNDILWFHKWVFSRGPESIVTSTSARGASCSPLPLLCRN